jgi:hypothetical protein
LIWRNVWNIAILFSKNDFDAIWGISDIAEYYCFASIDSQNKRIRLFCRGEDRARSRDLRALRSVFILFIMVLASSKKGTFTLILVFLKFKQNSKILLLYQIEGQVNHGKLDILHRRYLENNLEVYLIYTFNKIIELWRSNRIFIN